MARDEISSSPSEARAFRFAAIFGASLAVHALVASRLALGGRGDGAAAVVLSHVDIEFAPTPPPPPPPPEDAPPPPPEPAAPPKAATAPPTVSRPATLRPSPPAAALESALPASDDGILPVASPGTAAPSPDAVAFAPAAPAAPAPAPLPTPPPPPPVVEAKEGANYLKNPRPAYPRLALREGWEGKVVLRVKVLADGRVGGATVQRSTGRSVLDEAALEVVKGWTFVAAKVGDRAVVGWVSVPIEFRIN